MRSKIYLLISSMILIHSLLLPQKALAGVASEKSPYIETNEVINFQKDIKSDVFLIGSEINVNGNIDGDLFIVGQKVNINSNVKGNVRVFALDTKVNSYISGSLLFISQSVVITNTGDVDKSVYGYTQNFKLDGRVGGDLNLMFAPNAIIEVNGKVVGDFIYTDSRPNLGQNSTIQGQNKKVDNPFKASYSQKDMREYAIFAKVFHSFFLIIFAIFIIKSKGKWFIKSTEVYKRDFFKNSLIGLTVLLMLSVLTIFLTLTFFGVPLALSILGLLLLGFYISPIWAAVFISTKLFTNNPMHIAKIAICIVILDVITMIPVLGAFLTFIIQFAFFGMITAMFFEKTDLVVKKINE